VFGRQLPDVTAVSYPLQMLAPAKWQQKAAGRLASSWPGSSTAWPSLNQIDQVFLPFLLEDFEQEGIILTDYGFHCAQGVPKNVKPCKKGIWNERMVMETHFALITVICATPSTCFTARRRICKPVLLILPPCSTSMSPCGKSLISWLRVSKSTSGTSAYKNVSLAIGMALVSWLF
jgi:hypothetical protein